MRQEHISFVQRVLSYPNRSTDKTLCWLPDAIVYAQSKILKNTICLKYKSFPLTSDVETLAR